MKKSTIICVLLASIPARAVIISFNEIATDFTDPTVVITNVAWSEPDKFSVSTNGFGWSNGKTNDYRDYWIQSMPVAIGEHWRPAQGTTVMVGVEPAPAQQWLDCKVHVRYSPDKKHWSSWQALEQEASTNWNRPFPRYFNSKSQLFGMESPTNGYQLFHGEIDVPKVERQKYNQLLVEYWKMDVPSEDDENAAVKWILNREPYFFEKQLPFVGYVQYRMEGIMWGDQKIQRIEMRLDWAISGLMSIPKQPVTNTSPPGPWRFEAP